MFVPVGGLILLNNLLVANVECVCIWNHQTSARQDALDGTKSSDVVDCKV